MHLTHIGREHCYKDKGKSSDGKSCTDRPWVNQAYNKDDCIDQTEASGNIEQTEEWCRGLYKPCKWRNLAHQFVGPFTSTNWRDAYHLALLSQFPVRLGFFYVSTLLSMFTIHCISWMSPALGYLPLRVSLKKYIWRWDHLVHERHLLAMDFCWDGIVLSSYLGN